MCNKTTHEIIFLFTLFCSPLHWTEFICVLLFRFSFSFPFNAEKVFAEHVKCFDAVILWYARLNEKSQKTQWKVKKKKAVEKFGHCFKPYCSYPFVFDGIFFLTYSFQSCLFVIKNANKNESNKSTTELIWPIRAINNQTCPIERCTLNCFFVFFSTFFHFISIDGIKKQLIRAINLKCVEIRA